MNIDAKSSVVLLVLTSFLSSVAWAGGLWDHRRHSGFDNNAGFSATSFHYRFNSPHGDFSPYNGTPVNQYFFRQAYGSGALHVGGLISEDEHQYYGGVSFGPATIAYFEGQAKSFSKADDPLYNALDPYFFHGGSLATFRLQGVGANLDFGGGVSARFAYSSVQAPAAKNRHGYYAGVSSRHFEAGVFQLERGAEQVGGGLNLAFRGRRLAVKYQEIHNTYKSRLRRLALIWHSEPTETFSVELEQARNELYARAEDRQIMFRFRKSLGSAPVFRATDQGGDEGERQPGFRRTVAIGVGVGVAALAVSSGGGSDGARRFTVRNQAAFAVLNRVNPVSVRQNIEHGGWIYRNADNTFGYTDPVTGTLASVNIGNPATSVPFGTVASASYHTHGGPDPRFDSEHFSPQDLLSDRLTRTDGYLGTPAGFMKLHDFQTGTITVVGRIDN